MNYQIVLSGVLEVHRHLGPGLLESAYEQCLAHELRIKSMPFKLLRDLRVLRGEKRKMGQTDYDICKR